MIATLWFMSQHAIQIPEGISELQTFLRSSTALLHYPIRLEYPIYHTFFFFFNGRILQFLVKWKIHAREHALWLEMSLDKNYNLRYKNNLRKWYIIVLL